MLRKLSALILLFCSNYCIAQSSNPLMTDAHSKPLYLRTNYFPEGNPYLFENYVIAEVTLMDGKVYPTINARFNLVERQLVYIDENNQEMLVTSPVKSIRFFNSIDNGVMQEGVKLESIGKALNTPNAPIYDVMEDGKARLMKQIIVTYADNKRYGEATITRTFKRKEVYYAQLAPSDELKKIERNKEDVAGLFGSKQVQVSTYIEQNHLKCKSDEELTKVFHFYNSLFGQTASN